MNDQLLQLIAFWAAYFNSTQGDVIIRVGIRDKLVELLGALPASVDGVAELRRQAGLLKEAETVGINHPLNQAIFAFMVKHKKAIPDEFQTNFDNIKAFFAAKQS
jgi:hypothetical protein